MRGVSWRPRRAADGAHLGHTFTEASGAPKVLTLNAVRADLRSVSRLSVCTAHATLQNQRALPARPIIPLVARISDQNASGAPPMAVRDKSRLDKFQLLLASPSTDLGEPASPSRPSSAVLRWAAVAACRVTAVDSHTPGPGVPWRSPPADAQMLPSCLRA